MFGTRFSVSRLILDIFPLLLALLLSASFVRSAAAQTKSCTFQEVSSIEVPLTGGTVDGPEAFGFLTITKFTDGCGNEYGSMTPGGSGFEDLTSFSMCVGTQGFNALCVLFPTTLTTPVAFVGAGDGPVVCGGASLGVIDGGGGGGGCTPG